MPVEVGGKTLNFLRVELEKSDVFKTVKNKAGVGN